LCARRASRLPDPPRSIGPSQETDQRNLVGFLATLEMPQIAQKKPFHGWDLGGFIFLRVADSFCVAICGKNTVLASAMEISCFNDLWAYLYSATASFIISTLHKMTV
jgi:hypothetical protein